MKSKLGIQTQWDSGEALRYNREVQPTAVMGINVAKASWWRQIALDNPGVHRIYRHHPNSDEIPALVKWHVDPEQAALDFVVFLKGHLGDALDEIELVAGDNEFILSKDYEPPERIALADRFMAASVQEADLLLGKGVCVGNFNVGHWGPETVDYFPRTLTAIQAQAVRGERISYFCFHEYNWPLLWDDTHWYTGKFLRAMPPILEKYCSVHAMITEVGIDKASRISGEHAGWRKAHDDINIAVDAYCGDHGLAWYNDLLNQTDYVAVALIFGCGMRDWRGMGFDIMDSPDDTAVLDHIKTYPVVVPPEPPPPEEDPVEIKIYDYDGNEQDWDWLRAEFGDVRVHPVEEKFPIREGEHVYKVCYLRAKSGYAAILINTKNLEGQNIVGETVVFGWPTADPHKLPDEGHNWTGNGVVGLTNETGDVGPGMGTGAYYSPADGERGPHFCWVYGLPADKVDGLGMLAMTFHNHVDVGYCEFIAGESEPPVPPEPPVNGVLDKILVAIEAIKITTARILHILSATPPEPPEPPEPEAFRGEYFNNISLSGEPVFTRDDEEINFEWGNGSPDPRIPSDNFSVRWTGKRTFEAGTYRFHVMVDDGIRVWVDGILLIDAWKAQAPTPYQADIALSAGQHDVKVEYYERGGGAVCKLGWEKLL